jgi:hypothetical protein
MSTPQIERHKRTAIGIAILALFVIYSARRALFGDLLPTDAMLGIALQILMVMFCVADSHVIQTRLAHVFRWIIFFTWPVSVPIYFVWTRGLKGLLYIAVSLIIIVLAGTIAFFAATALRP